MDQKCRRILGFLLKNVDVNKSELYTIVSAAPRFVGSVSPPSAKHRDLGRLR